MDTLDSVLFLVSPTQNSKEANIILVEEGDGNQVQVKVIDFGIAKSIEQEEQSEDGKRSTIAGSPLYMSPDSGQGRAYDARSEVYSAGCVLFECVAGSPPFKGDTPLSTLSMHARDPVPALSEYGVEDIDPRVEEVIRKALEKDPANRFQSIDEFKKAIEEIMEREEETITASSPAKLLANSKPDISTILLMFLFLVTVPALAYYVLTVQSKGKVPKKNIPDISQNRVLKELDEKESLWRLEEHNSIRGYNITDESLKEINNYPKTRTIKIMPPNEVTGTGLQYVRKKKKIKSICMFSEHFNEEGASYIPEFPNIVYLKVSHSKLLTPAAIRYILSPEHLQTLELKHIADLPAGTLKALGRKTSLRFLDISDCKPIKKEDIEDLVDNNHITNLKLSDTAVDDSMASIFVNSKIRQLNLCRTKFSDKGLEKLTKMKTLNYLSITLDKEQITDAGVELFKHSRPDCTVNLHDRKNRPIGKKQEPVKLDAPVQDLLIDSP